MKNKKNYKIVVVVKLNKLKVFIDIYDRSSIKLIKIR